MTIKDNEFKCAVCGNVYEREWSKEQAADEAKELWGKKVMEEPYEELCDDCFKEIMGEIETEVKAHDV